jgi:hypothetical protein
MLRYTRKFPHLPGRFSFQINIANLLDKTDIVPVRLLTDDPTFTSRVATAWPTAATTSSIRGKCGSPPPIRFETGPIWFSRVEPTASETNTPPCS